MIQIADVKIDDVLTVDEFGYRVLSVNMQKNTVTVQLLCKFDDDSCRRITRTYKNKDKYTVVPDWFNGKYFAKAVIV